jgi:hypothetical protein
MIKKICKRVYHKPIVQNTILKLISPIYPDIHKVKDAEFRYGLWNITSCLFQPNKRQLGEDNVFQSMRKKRVKTEYRISTHEGKRKGLMVNMTALKDVMRNWNSTMEVLAAIRSHYLSTMKIENEVFNAGELLIFTKHVNSLPVYIVRNKDENGLEGIVDCNVATIFQLVGGAFTLIKKCLEDIESGITLSSQLSPEWLFDYGDANLLFNTPQIGQACGGTRNKIVELLDFLIQGNQSEKKYKEDSSLLLIRAENPDAYLSYSLTVFQLEILIKQCDLATVELFSSMSDNTKTQVTRDLLNNSDLFFDKPDLDNINVLKLANHRLTMRKELVEKIHRKQLILENKTNNKSIHRPLEIKSINEDDNYKRGLTLEDVLSKYKILLKNCENEAIFLQNRIRKQLGENKPIKLSKSILKKRLCLIDNKNINKL